MKQPTKQELRDKIAELELDNRTLQLRYDNGITSYDWDLNAKLNKLRVEARRATLAAYALLAILVGVVIMGVVWNL